MNIQKHTADVCVIGGGMAGLCAAIAAARNGAVTVLMHDRPVLGGNASSEMRIHICGADRQGDIINMRETGILEEIRLENLYRNPNRNFSIWDTVLYEKAMLQPNLTTLFNCSCVNAGMEGITIKSVTGWQLNTYTHHEISAKIFIDCSGDSVLASLSGAMYRQGREGNNEFNESVAPEKADEKTMGMTCLFHSRKYDTAQVFKPYAWAYTFEKDDELPYGAKGHGWFEMGYWWVELGGEADTIRDTEKLRHELLRIVFGLWDHIKNRGDHGADNWALDWVQFLPAKRENRRYIGDHILNQNDVEAEGRFDDLVAYGGWPMDDHHPAGFCAVKLSNPATIFHSAPSPFGIPYRCLYSKNISNLMFAGRNVSCTHLAMSATRVMGTGCSMGQAAGTAAALAAKSSQTPRDILGRIRELQQVLIRDDCYLPWVKQEFSQLTKDAVIESSSGSGESVRDGINRPVGQEQHGWSCRPGESLTLTFSQEHSVEQATMLLDSALHRLNALSYHQGDEQLTSVPPEMTKSYTLEGLFNGTWTVITRVENNYQRLVRVPIQKNIQGVRFTLHETWGSDQSTVYSFNVE
ncbi:MAG: hypothetical protein A2268_07365 [Candidatus Raymondbacteria bacterium RifOxyA12_full_50_37]|uniref:Fumarate reductase n=1 Tax=Candidatus Raymondbacteria bacterium RIFOXYD12_FULL_49_13 TaxID=1817890 RepID=A0A1F7F656_UNCRA|nr:MAG: hypothetical protein A2268_07365 [Candidatus Raymondbacteria bacterium RifOxyA12_full_50_37]OGJ91200.1 MAG: hypothetical protein A2248_01510 [Candidatus Raymondbacteria bacterium RIFOXYA2_FULL_49_16]OGJ95383.1 MAG: hypothetical protein A2487_18130 [Candidatus Raymondbacteria bacterium RifOxyC12_full_50_8]OGJ97598.1 MAG: hypothetical protein A2453_02275 [Candidatus Raymondbacteria bacterium RIFOXYC2_FULL_50_21]OGK02058.1 MAG: hypothetical protein A2519_18720 [Candidatus Raymondbacteria b